MVDTIKNTLLEAEKLAVKIKKKAKRNDLDYSIQISVSAADPKTIYYAAQITPMAEGIAPQTFIAKDGDQLLKKMQDALDLKMSASQIEKAYHEAQMKHAERTVAYHKESIEKLDKEENEEGEKE